MHIPLYFEKLSKFERKAEPCSISIPFRQGAVMPSSEITIMDGSEAVATQGRVTAQWPDGSVKWMLLHFMADLPAGESKSFTCKPHVRTTFPARPVNVVMGEPDGECFINTGELQVNLRGARGKGLFHSLHRRNGIRMEESIGPEIQDRNGCRYVPEINARGWTVLEAGPVRAVVQSQGVHVGADGRQWFDFEARVYAYAGKPWLRVEYQIINKQPEREQLIRSLEMAWRSHRKTIADGNIEMGLGRSNYATTIYRGETGSRLSHCITAESLLSEANEHNPEVFYGTFWGAWAERGVGGFAVTVHQAQQNFPKQLDIADTGVRVGLIPEGSNVIMRQGMAKTHRFFLHLFEPGETMEQVNVRSLQFQMPDQPVLDSMVYEEAGVMEQLSVLRMNDEAERALSMLADSRMRAYGMLHWGDGPDPDYSAQGDGNIVWSNNEYDLPHSAMHLYARKGDRKDLSALLVAAEHWMDVDICHFSKDPLRHLGQLIPSADHASGEPAVWHEWVEGLLDYYHMTGEWRALRAAIGIGNNIIRLLATPQFQTEGELQVREYGWALRSIVALFKETEDNKWLRAAEHIVEQFAAWKDKHGAWLSPYSDHAMVRVPSLIGIAVNSLMRYYRLKPQERIKEMIVDAVRDMIKHTYRKNEKVFVYKELPSLFRFDTPDPTVLESLAYAYELTGDTSFLEAGRATFRTSLNRIERECRSGIVKAIVGDALIVGQGAGPKMFAQQYYPLFYYYRTAAGAGFSL
ncbi:beta-L-arabinofuranosidase domain-containing protein [Paenibacillus sp. HB172176]|uniref:exo-rhamnogalacturonan lyase family protein n=1 Tax=Paenibacillus sp. HB172176 TaxID=2493690 RepID=UPI0023F98357|nr:beta-L-arabinofuranosidase domain-containing protein [Paenibacillus sp. HB172176]